MAICLNTSLPEFKRGLALSGLPEEQYRSLASRFVDEFGRYPYLDEIPHANSLPVLAKNLKATESGNVNNENIFKYTQTQDIKSANIAINDIHRDLRVKIYPFDKTSIVRVQKRPNEWEDFAREPLSYEDKVSDGLNSNIWGKIADHLSNYYGINIKLTNNEELNSSEELSPLIDTRTTNAFIYNGDIYINADNARTDAPIHEMMHLLVGSLKFSNPDLYNGVVSIAEQLPRYKKISKEFVNRAKSDIDEEIFISEFSKYVTGQSSELDKLGEQPLKEIFYNVYRVLDSTVFGDLSVKSIAPDMLFKMPLDRLCKAVNSDLITSKFSGTLNLNDASLNRILANKKSDLMKSKELQEICV